MTVMRVITPMLQNTEKCKKKSLEASRRERLFWQKISFYAPNFEKVGSILLSACPFFCPFVRSFKKNLKLGF